MSAMMTTWPRSTVSLDPAGPVQEAGTGPSCDSPVLKPMARPLEAPEEAIRQEEAPESWEEWKTEAPDAGRGECFEREFTHGRSRS